MRFPILSSIIWIFYFFASVSPWQWITFFFLSVSCGSLKEAASTAYAQVFAPYHTWAIRTAVYAGMCALPTREQLLLNLNETGEFIISLWAEKIWFYRFFQHQKAILMTIWTRWSKFELDPRLSFDTGGNLSGYMKPSRQY